MNGQPTDRLTFGENKFMNKNTMCSKICDNTQTNVFHWALGINSNLQETNFVSNKLPRHCLDYYHTTSISDIRDNQAVCTE